MGGGGGRSVGWGVAHRSPIIYSGAYIMRYYGVELLWIVHEVFFVWFVARAVFVSVGLLRFMYHIICMMYHRRLCFTSFKSAVVLRKCVACCSSRPYTTKLIHVLYCKSHGAKRNYCCCWCVNTLHTHGRAHITCRNTSSCFKSAVHVQYIC